jgi:hypothetical protein
MAMAKRYLNSLPFDSPVIFYAADHIDCKQLLPKSLHALVSPKLAKTSVWYDKKKELFTIHIFNSFPNIHFNLSKDGLHIQACEFFWDSYRVSVPPEVCAKMSMDDIATIATSYPHDNFKFILDKCKPNIRIKQMLESKLKE